MKSFVSCKSSRVGMRLANYMLFISMYRIILDIIYFEIVSRYFAYNGFLNQPTWGMMTLSWILLVFFTVVCRNYYLKSECISDQVMFFLFLLSVVPFTSLVGYGQYEIVFVMANTIYWCLFFTIQTTFKRVKNKMVISKRSCLRLFGEKQLMFFSCFLMLVVLFISGKYTGFRFTFDLFSVYELRDEAASYALPTIIGYFFTWAKSINPIFLAYFIKRKKNGWVLFGIIVQLLSFGIDGLKSTLFMLMIIIMFNLVPGKFMKNINFWIVSALSALAGIAVGIYMVCGNYSIVTLVFRRFLFVPNQLSGYYFDFFTTHVPDFFRSSFLRHFGFSSPYSRIVNLIGEIYYNNPNIACNNGLLSDAICNMGVAGIIIMPLLWGITLKIIDICAERLDKRIHLSVAFMMTYLMISTFYFTIMVTYGLFVIMIILLLMKRKENVKVTT